MSQMSHTSTPCTAWYVKADKWSDLSLVTATHLTTSFCQSNLFPISQLTVWWSGTRVTCFTPPLRESVQLSTTNHPLQASSVLLHHIVMVEDSPVSGPPPVAGGQLDPPDQECCLTCLTCLTCWDGGDRIKPARCPARCLWSAFNLLDVKLCHCSLTMGL